MRPAEAVDVDVIPHELRKLRQWVTWQYIERGGKRTKPPYQTNGELASVADPLTWATCERAVEAYETGSFAGIGVILTATDPYTAFDLDHCRDPATGEVAPWAREIVKALDSYTEITPSGEGLRVLVRATLPPGRRRKDRMEVYDEQRYVTVTGRHLDGTPKTIAERQEVVERIHAETFGEPKKATKPRPAQPVDLDDADLLERARRAGNGADFDRLWRGEWHDRFGSQSEADLAFCNMLAFWTGGDAARVDSLVRQSSLMRDKWDRRTYSNGDTYGQRTVATALAGTSERYKLPTRPSPNGAPRTKPKAAPVATASAPPPDFRPTDAGNGEHFAQRYGAITRYDHRRGRWNIFRDHWWEPDTIAEVRPLAKEAARQRFADAARIDDLKERAARAKWALQSENKSRIDAALAQATSEPPIADSGEGWDADPMLLGVANGVVDLRTGELRDGRPEDRITMRTPVAFDAKAECPRWLCFLEEVFAGNHELIEFVRRAVGYCLTGDTSEQCWFLCVGAGANGKSTLMAILLLLLGDYATNMPFSTIELRGRAQATNDLADLAGRRLVTASETNAGARVNEARVKALTGEDQMTARRLYEEFKTFTPTLKLWLSVNHPPRVDDDSYAFWRRVRLIPFNERFEGERRDPKLREKLSAELPGILAWALSGCLDWQRDGLAPPETVRIATERYREDSDQLAAFVAERCVVAPDVSVPAGDLYRAYQAWAEGCGLRDRERLSATKFGTKAGERFQRGRNPSGKVRIYTGIALNGSAQATFGAPEEADSDGLEPPSVSTLTGSDPIPKLPLANSSTRELLKPPSDLSDLSDHCACGKQVERYSPEGMAYCADCDPGRGDS